MLAQSKADADATRRFGYTMMGNARQAAEEARQERLAIQRERLANTVAQQNQADVTKFGGTLTKNGLPQIANAVSDIHEMLDKPEGTLAGIGYGKETLSKIPIISDLTVGEEGKANRSKVQRLINALTLTEAGKAVTKQEGVRQAIANMASDNYSEKDFRNAMEKTILPALENTRSNVMKSTDPSIVDQYIKNDDSGYNPRKSFLRGRGVTAGGIVTPPSIPGMVPDVPRKPPAEMHFDANGKLISQ
jgi:hypothetical protein